MEEKNYVKGYKVFNFDWTCSPNGHTKQYTCPGKFEENISPVRCGQGMHFCKKAADCFNYYSFTPNNRVAEVIAYGDIAEEGNKCCTNKLKIVREIPWAELLEIVNTGKSCTGYCNSGNYNSGNYNSGNCNSGNYNSGNCNSGNCNSGNYNSGYCNSGNYNSGYCNSGDWNSSNYNNGCFNTKSPIIFLFDRISDWTYQDWLNSDAKRILRGIPSNLLWISENNMTDEEKVAHPEYQTTGGFLKRVETKTERQKWWDNLSDEDKECVMSLPNFDKSIFEKITGIKVD